MTILEYCNIIILQYYNITIIVDTMFPLQCQEQHMHFARSKIHLKSIFGALFTIALPCDFKAVKDSGGHWGYFESGCAQRYTMMR